LDESLIDDQRRQPMPRALSIGLVDDGRFNGMQL
jgi:hypothetical protein